MNLESATAFTVIFPSRSLNGLVYFMVLRSAPKAANGSGLEPSRVKNISAFGVSEIIAIKKNKKHN